VKHSAQGWHRARGYFTLQVKRETRKSKMVLPPVYFTTTPQPLAVGTCQNNIYNNSKLCSVECVQVPFNSRLDDPEHS